MMPIDVLCPGCGKTLRLADEHAGKTGRCPSCQSHFQIPAAHEQTSNAPTPSAPGFEQLVAQLQPNSTNTNPPIVNSPAPDPLTKKPLFGEDRPASQPTPYQLPSPFAETTPNSDLPNPYAAPQTYSAPMSNPQQDPNNYTAVATVLGIISICLSLVGLCCCPVGVISLPMSIIGLVLTYQIPRENRTLPLVLNIVSLALPLVLILLYVVFAAINIQQGP